MAFRLLRAALILLFPMLFAGSALAQTTVTLQQGLNGYTGTTDTKIWANNPTTNYGADGGYSVSRETDRSSVLVRFAIFAAEGGPVPDGATITSATLSLYKYFGQEATIKASRLLKNWNEAQATWNIAATGTSWTTAGALSAGNDYASTADGQGSVGNASTDGCSDWPNFPTACWLNIDVTSGVQAFKANQASNFGWKIAYVSGGDQFSNKDFDSSEYTHQIARPKLTVTYTTTPPPSGNTVTLQQGLNSYTGTTDTKIWATNPTTNYRADGGYSVSREADRSSVLIRFAIFAAEGGPVPDGATITSATLSLYKYFGLEATLKASRLLKNWNEAQATWNIAASGTSWTTAGALSAGNDYASTADGQGSVGNASTDGCSDWPNFPAACWLNIDVTSGVQAFKANPGSNFGWKIAYVSGGDQFSNKDFDSSEYTHQIARPKLTITYTDGNPTLPTAQLSADQTSGTGPLTVTFNASGSTDGGSPITNLRLQFGHGNPPQEVNWTNKNETKQYTYPAGAAQYTATLTVTNAIGNSQPKTQNITVTTGAVPTPSFSWSQTPGTKEITFNAAGSLDGDGPITQLRLEFGDGTPDAIWSDKSQPKTHTYANFQSHPAKLWATNAHGTSATPYSTQVDVIDPNQGSGEFPPDPAMTAIPTTGDDSGETRATFHSMSLYWNPIAFSDADPPPGNQIFVRYRRATENPAAPGFTWKQGWPLWYDTRNFIDGWGPLPHAYRARGSLVYLTPGTKYVVELGSGPNYAEADFTHTIVGTTRSEVPGPGSGACVAAANVVCVASGNQPFVITQGGSPGNYRIYDGWNGTSKNIINRDVPNRTDLGPNLHDDIHDPENHPNTSSAVVIKASFVIVRRLTIKGAALSNIYIHPNVTDVIIEDNEITDWAWRKHGTDREGWGPYGTNYAGGVLLSGNNSRIVIQRNKIYDPHLGAYPWDFNHPSGPSAITIWNGGRQNVIRYNEIYSTVSDNRHWVQDGIMGVANFSANGAPGADSDIYHNNIRNVMDDAIEAEGGGTNVRIWGNYIDHTAVGVASAVAHFGPLYVFRNVINRQRHFHNVPRDNDAGNKAFKAYGWGTDPETGITWGGGRQYFFHNTTLQQPGSTHGWGANEGIAGDSPVRTWSRNNILHVWSSSRSSIRIGNAHPLQPVTGNDFNYDLHNGSVPSGTEQQGITRAPTYQNQEGWREFPRLTVEPDGPTDTTFGSGFDVGLGRFRLSSGSLDLNAGTPLPNFTFDIDNTALASKSGVAVGSGNPDMGAHDSALTTPMKFGIPAAAP